MKAGYFIYGRQKTQFPKLQTPPGKNIQLRFPAE